MFEWVNFRNNFKLRFFLAVTLILGSLVCSNAIAVTNQELMDRLDDIEIDMQNREVERQLREMQTLFERQQKNLPSSRSQNKQGKLESCGLIWKYSNGSISIEKASFYDATSENYKNLQFPKPSKRGYVESLYPMLREADKRNNVNEAKFLANEIINNSVTLFYSKDITKPELRGNIIAYRKINELCP